MLVSSAWHKLEVSFRNWFFLIYFYFFPSFLISVSLYQKTIVASLTNFQEAKTVLS